MSGVRLKINIEKRLETFTLAVALEVCAEILVLFGASGAGKTQTLNAVAGLTTPDRGEITLDEKMFFLRDDKNGQPPIDLPARKRRVGYVFQSYALFPHLTALENVAFALSRQPEARRRAQDLLERMRLEQFALRYPHELSGGQQQRVAIARALAMEPQVLLMDEPFAALDSPTRGRLHQELKKLQTESQLVVIYVTHNLNDAFAVGHRLAVMQEGRIEQVGEPREVFNHPASGGVKELLGASDIPVRP